MLGHVSRQPRIRILPPTERKTVPVRRHRMRTLVYRKKKQLVAQGLDSVTQVQQGLQDEPAHQQGSVNQTEQVNQAEPDSQVDSVSQDEQAQGLNSVVTEAEHSQGPEEEANERTEEN